MKKIFLFTAAFLLVTSLFAAAPNEKVLNSFAKTFQNVKEVTWQERENNYEASFEQDDIALRISYDENGDVVKTIRYYTVQNLPIFILANLTKKYEGKKVYGVTEVSTANEVIYHIVLEDEKTWTYIESDFFGNMQTKDKFHKALNLFE